MPADNGTIQEVIDSLLEEQRVVAQTQDEDQILSHVSRSIPESEPVENKDQANVSGPPSDSLETSDSAEVPQQETLEENPRLDVPGAEFSFPDQEPVPENQADDSRPEQFDTRTGGSSLDALPPGVGGSVDFAPGDSPDLPESSDLSGAEQEPAPTEPGEVEVDSAAVPESDSESADPQVDAKAQVESQQFTPESSDWISATEDFHIEHGDLPPGSGEFSPQDSGFSTGRDTLEHELPEPFQSMVMQFGEKLDSVREQLSEMVSEQIAQFGSQVYADAASTVNDEMEEMKLLMDRRYSQ